MVVKNLNRWMPNSKENKAVVLKQYYSFYTNNGISKVCINETSNDIQIKTIITIRMTLGKSKSTTNLKSMSM